VLTLLLALCAHAESGAVLPAGAGVGYAGVGLSTFETGSSGLPRDRQLRSRLDLYCAWGVARRLQLSVDVPLVYNTTVAIEGRGPCPGVGDWCAPVASAGEAGVHLRAQLVDSAFDLTVGLGLRTDAWNAPTRDRWTNAGLGTTAGVASLIAEQAIGGGAALAYGHFALVDGRAVDGPGTPRLPGDLLVGGLVGRAPLGRLTGEVELSGLSRLAGVPYGDVWLDQYYDTPDRWAALRYRELKARAKLSIPLGDRSGLHISAGRVLLVDSGPRDATDLSVGVHRYLPPR
jgi:hypothetical protein